MMNYIFNTFQFDKRMKYSAGEQLFYHVVQMIISFQVIPNQSFPKASELALKLNITPTDVEVAYDMLLKARYCLPVGSTIGVVYTDYPDSLSLNLNNVLAVEQVLSFHQLNEQIDVIEDASPSLSKALLDWMMLSKENKRRELHRLHYGKGIPMIYSLIAIDPAYLSIHQESSIQVSELIEDWSSNSAIEWTTMVLFSIALPEPLANYFGVLEGSSTYAVRSSALNNNGMMLGTFMYVFTPRVYFNTQLIVD